MSDGKGACDGCDCASSCPCVCLCTPCKCKCITKESAQKTEFKANLDSQIVMRRIGGLDLALLAVTLDANSSIEILIPGHNALEKVSIDEFPGGTLQEALEQLGLRYKK